MLQAMNTGHDGSLSTVHANGPATRCGGSRRSSSWPGSTCRMRRCASRWPPRSTWSCRSPAARMVSGGSSRFTASSAATVRGSSFRGPRRGALRRRRARVSAVLLAGLAGLACLASAPAQRLPRPKCCDASVRCGASEPSNANCPTRSGASPPSWGPVARPTARSWPWAQRAVRPERRSRSRAGEQRPGRTSRLRWRQRSVSVRASQRQRSRSSYGPEGTCRRCSDRWRGTRGTARRQRGDPRADGAGAVVGAGRAAPAGRRPRARGTARCRRGALAADDGARPCHRRGRRRTRPRGPARDPGDRAGSRERHPRRSRRRRRSGRAAVAGAAVARTRVPGGRAVTWHELGASPAVVEWAAVGAVTLAVRRHGLMGRARTDAALADALPERSTCSRPASRAERR